MSSDKKEETMSSDKKCPKVKEETPLHGAAFAFISGTLGLFSCGMASVAMLYIFKSPMAQTGILLGATMTFVALGGVVVYAATQSDFYGVTDDLIAVVLFIVAGFLSYLTYRSYHHLPPKPTPTKLDLEAQTDSKN
jgi:uncharacterized membrane protein YfcA